MKLLLLTIVIMAITTPLLAEGNCSIGSTIRCVIKDSVKVPTSCYKKKLTNPGTKTAACDGSPTETGCLIESLSGTSSICSRCDFRGGYMTKTSAPSTFAKTCIKCASTTHFVTGGVCTARVISKDNCVSRENSKDECDTCASGYYKTSDDVACKAVTTKVANCT